MTAATAQLMTAEQFHDWVNRPENSGKHYELDCGRVVEVSRPGEQHGFVAGNIGPECRGSELPTRFAGRT